MYRKRLAAFILTGCVLTNIGCSSSGSGSGLFSGGGCCGHGSGSGPLGKLFGSNSNPPAMAGGPVTGGAFYAGGGADCPCSNHGGNDGVFHPAVMNQGVSGGGPVMGDMSGQAFPQGMPIQGAPQYPTQPVPTITPGVPPGVPQNPMTNPPRIQPVPMAPSGVAPSGGMAPSSPWGPGPH